MLVVHDLVSCRFVIGQMLLQPYERWSHLRVLIPQALHELHDKCRRQPGFIAMFAKQCVRLRCATVNPEQSVRNHVGFLPCDTAAHDALRCAAHVFHKYDPQRNRNRPELSNGERMDGLIGAHEAPQSLRIEATVGMRDERPSHAEYPRVAGEGAIGELRQFSIVTGRQIDANLADLLLDDVIIIEQPFSRWRDRASRVHGSRDVSIGCEQNRCVVP